MAEVPAASRQPYSGSPRQLVEDLAVLAENGVDHAYVSLSDAVDNVTRMIDAAEELYTEAKNAGLV
jgi:hypothetical protein